MKVAICISGGLRYPYLGLKSIEKIIPNHDVKVFIHTWKIKDKESFLKTVSGVQYKEIDKTVQQEISLFEIYDYEKILVEDYDTHQKKFQHLFESLKFTYPDPAYPDEGYPRSDVGPISMHYSIYKSNELKKQYESENNMKFDWVIRMRPDSDFKNELDLYSLMEDLNIPEGEDWRGGINDQFAVGRSHVMDLYSSFYNNIHYLQSSVYHPETLMLNHLKNMNLTPNRFNLIVRINNGIDFRRILFGT